MGQQTVAVRSSHPLTRKLTQGFRSRDDFLIVVPLQPGLYPRRPTIRDKTTAQYKGTLTGALGEEEEIIIVPQMQEVKTQPNSFTKISVYYLTLNGFKCHEAPLKEI